MSCNQKIKGNIFDIHRFALHDGPGIRTTVFLKGCPLRCQWCHNPESISSKPQLGYFEDRCSLCEECVKVCPNGVHELVNEKHILNREKCIACGACVKICPNNALVIAGKEISVDEVMDVLIKDKTYFDESGGGITLSGGEPLIQPEFAFDILQKSKEAGIHTCVDTSGAISQEIFKKIMDYTDLFLYDYKATDPNKHLELTGQFNQCILNNLQFLHDSGKEIIVRCPLVPNVNDDERHLQAIAELERILPQLEAIQLMIYHSTGASKYDRYRINNPLKNYVGIELDYSKKILDWFQQQGCYKILIEE